MNAENPDNTIIQESTLRQFKEHDGQYSLNDQVLAQKAGTLRNRLSVIKHKCDETIRLNKRNRDDIDERRKERVIFDRVYKDLEVHYKASLNKF